MARDHGRILASIWADDDFTSLPPGPQRLYLFLLTQADLSYAGVVAMRLRRWATLAGDLDTDALRYDLAALADARFVVVDHDTEEVLVRTFIRNDGIWRQPNVMKAAVKAAREILSPHLRAALAAELLRIPVLELSNEPKKGSADPSTSTRALITTCILELLEALGNPSGNPSGNGSPNPTEGVTETLPGTPPVRAFPPLSPSPSPEEDLSSEIADAITDDARDPGQDRPDIVALCQHLADRIEANGSKRPRIGKRWYTSARLLIDVDGRTPDQVRNAIDWCQNDEFWRSNILSMPTLREKYDQLRLAAQRTTPGRPGDRQLDALRDGYAWAQQHDAQQQATDTHDTPLAIGAP